MTLKLDRRLALAGLPALLAVPAFLRGAAAQTAPAPAAAPAAPQAPGFYRFKVGGFTVTTVHDGYFERPLQGFVRNAPLEDVQKVLAESFLPTDRFRIPFTVTFVETPSQLIVFVCQQQPSGWRRVSSRQFSQFFFEVLKAQIESEPGFVFAKESARELYVFNAFNLADSGHGL